MSEDEVARLRDDLARALGEHYAENPVPGMPPMHYAGARVVLDVLARHAALSGVPEGAAMDADQARLRREMRACLEIAREWMRLDATRDQT